MYDKNVKSECILTKLQAVNQVVLIEAGSQIQAMVSNRTGDLTVLF